MKWAPESLMNPPPLFMIEPPLVSLPEFVIVPELLNKRPSIRLLPGPRVRLAPESIFSVLPVASWRPFAFPLVLSSTVLVPFRMQAFVEAVGVPLVQLPLRSQKLSPPFCQVVEGAFSVPHCAHDCPAPRSMDAISAAETMKAERKSLKR